MNKKPELLVTAGSVEESNVMMDAGADALLIGQDKFGMRLSGDFSMDDIRETVQLGHARNVRIVVSLHNLMTNDILSLLPDYVKALGEAGVDAVEFNDPAVILAVRTHAPSVKLHWNAEMTSTNYATANYWGRKGASRVVLARELSMDEIISMKNELQIESQVQVHGMTNIYHSKRHLVESYMSHQGRPVLDGNLSKERGLFLIEAERAEERYPIYEDVNGTHIMSSDDICILEDLHLLIESGVNSFKVEGLLKPLVYNEMVVKSYRQAIDTYVADPLNYVYQEQWMDNIRNVQDHNRELSFGFFYKEQVY
ncbi:peptidase U32 family protein [Paenibacillus sp. IHBB 10380]|uniref:peptidase U32 family protein n=1 Tax=Paenibacillus sp. IHBB 10380 TaxID=1566358 RepID=UPI0005CFD53C|nr:peptidase U32 family protein [Paenibacillus sp. IHBB 10380]AJS57562.1 peptidase U32 [Paenibacillus sp. IHBB 10380]